MYSLQPTSASRLTCQSHLIISSDVFYRLMSSLSAKSIAFGHFTKYVVDDIDDLTRCGVRCGIRSIILDFTRSVFYNSPVELDDILIGCGSVTLECFRQMYSWLVVISPDLFVRNQGILNSS